MSDDDVFIEWKRKNPLADMVRQLREMGYTVVEPEMPRTITVNGVEVPEPMREYPKST